MAQVKKTTKSKKASVKKKTASQVKKAPKKAKKKAPTVQTAKKQPGTKTYEKQLEAMREDLTQLVQHTQAQAGYDPMMEPEGDEADVATNASEKELAFQLSDHERQKLDAIEAALRKIEKGQFGKCESCGKQISTKRLHFIPEARYCIDCQSRFDG